MLIENELENEVQDNMGKCNQMKRINALVISGLLAVGSFLIVHFCCGNSYAINDDRYIAEILSGCVTGSPEAHAIFVHYFLGVIISLLYRISLKVAWWGLFLTICIIISLTVIFYGIISRSKNGVATLCSVALCLIIAVSCLNFIAEYQFTLVAGIIAVAGYSALVSFDNKRRGIVLFVVFELLSFWIRYESMLFVQPIGFAGWMMLFYARNESFFSKEGQKHFWLRAFKLLGVVLGVISISLITNIFGYGSDKWKNYIEYNKARSYIEDYSTGYSSETIEDILFEYGVSKEEFDVAFKNHFTVNNHIETECLLKVVERFKEGKSNPNSIKELIYRAVTFGKYDNIKGFFGYNYLLYFIALVAILVNKKWRYFSTLATTYFIKLFLLFYLVYINRYPFRVTGILYFVEMIMISTVLEDILCDFDTSLVKKSISLTSVLIAFVLCLVVAKPVFLEERETNSFNASYTKAMHEFKDYFEDKSEGYIVDITSVLDYPGDVFDASWYLHQNTILSGGWFSNAPFMMDYEQSYLKKYENNLSFVTLSDKESAEYICTYIEKTWNANLEKTDEITLENGIRYDVFKINSISD